MAPLTPAQSFDALAILPPGIVATRAIVDGLSAAWAAGGFIPLTPAQVLVVTGPSPVAPTHLPRFADSNPAPFDDWVQYGASPIGGVAS
ncbi:MAG TPA: hypothetical protein VNT30_09350 [Stellaceae bacterium]|nr:hypothetical protein [Stellaceae bacterium]